jgi:thymidylate synthase ThyX
MPKQISAQVILWSRNAATGADIITIKGTFPRFILAEWNTHKIFSRNSASSRAVPLAKMRERVMCDPYIPQFTKNQKGMASNTYFDEHDQKYLERWCLGVLQAAESFHETMENKGVHKQHANRYLEPWMWHEAIITSTCWSNLFKLRSNDAAQPEIHQFVNGIIRHAINGCQPQLLKEGEWHLPLFTQYNEMQPRTPEGYSVAESILISGARCARVSYYLQNNKVSDIDSDLGLGRRLVKSGHFSPFEHVATPLPATNNLNRQNYMLSNFVGWAQARKFLIGEDGGEHLNEVAPITSAEAKLMLDPYTIDTIHSLNNLLKG